MAGELRLDSVRAGQRGRDLTTAGEALVRLQQEAATIKAESAPQPWGKDEIGAQFQKSYGPALEQFVTALTSVSGFVLQMGMNAEETVTMNVEADKRSSVTVHRAPIVT